uniref:Uncharacterized protein n=1 Tax=Noctiluca scintillans TaxID=2966 RepID=A0A7S1AYR8_NOCSC|mmetsp:Transcript_65639/g.173830  ORF Transcript_65639/g.173830 Transcript_65639/m.173830 type:complete len:231 (+) Transcript_65639:58-750(+)|eukprot:CAMPEP_0194481664 /NCGR_PEP_ID=MMETSP0253-20130528/3982_1 /TAXON_ID=2966 /ORGANISM="Noctiluca scintillans" /LENGTH=230 /DNA_ID=CAMNT_0039321165 /DNA_START=42 /DNA_END=734 /DNA_ORIENTATION=+
MDDCCSCFTGLRQVLGGGDAKALANGPKVFLMRHGQSQANVDPRPTMEHDPDPLLSPEGVHQASMWADEIGQFGIEKVYVSPLRRTTQTALHAFSRTKVPLEFLRCAREIPWFGADGWPENQIASSPDSMYSLLASLPRGNSLHPVHEALTEADDESTEDACIRKLLRTLRGSPCSSVGVVTHGLTMMRLTDQDHVSHNVTLLECDWRADGKLYVVKHHRPYDEQRQQQL